MFPVPEQGGKKTEEGSRRVILLKEEYIFCTINFCPHEFEAASINPDRER